VTRSYHKGQEKGWLRGRSKVGEEEETNGQNMLGEGGQGGGREKTKIGNCRDAVVAN
jgi:hypothetical protein